jgi:hypothetical protein
MTVTDDVTDNCRLPKIKHLCPGWRSRSCTDWTLLIQHYALYHGWEDLIRPDRTIKPTRGNIYDSNTTIKNYMLFEYAHVMDII